MGKVGTVTAQMRTAQLAEGQKAGLCLIGGNIFEIGLIYSEGKLNIFSSHKGTVTMGPLVSGKSVQLRAVVDLKNDRTVLQYSTDASTFLQLGPPCELSGSNYWKAVRPALFSYNTKQQKGTALFDWFQYRHDGTGGGNLGKFP